MRRLFLGAELDRATLRWGVRKGRWRRIDRGVYGMGSHEPSALDRARAAAMATGGVASGRFAGVILGLDSVTLDGTDITLPPSRSGRRPGVRRGMLDERHVVSIAGVRCTDGWQTLVDLARLLDDAHWEQALESAVRKGLVKVGDLDSEQSARIRRVLALRPAGAAATESLLETLMVQLARTVEGLSPPVRQLKVVDAHGQVVARLDLAWPELGLFIEIDGQHHAGQPVYDANRETAVVASTGWLCGRFTWTEVVHAPRSTARRLAALVDQARRRPVVAC